MNDSSDCSTTASESPEPPEDPSESIDTPPTSFLIDRHDGLGQRSLKSQVEHAPGDVLAEFSGRRHFDHPSRMTVQVSEDAHIELSPTWLELINHSCDPNVAFDTARMVLVALRPIAAGDELCFFYPSTEWTMQSPFECVCGSPRCLGRITGASRIAPATLSAYRLAPHIQRLLAAQEGQESRSIVGELLSFFAPA